MPQPKVILSYLEELDNDFVDPIKKQINKIHECFCSTSRDETTVSLCERRVETFTVKLDDIRN